MITSLPSGEMKTWGEEKGRVLWNKVVGLPAENNSTWERCEEMSGTRPEDNTRVSRKERRQGLRLAVPLAVFLWIALLGGGFWLAKGYIDNSLRDIQDTNALHVQALQDKLESLSQKLEELERALETADDTIARSSITQEELNERIMELDRQLEKLEESLRILKESDDAVAN